MAEAEDPGAMAKKFPEPTNDGGTERAQSAADLMSREHNRSSTVSSGYGTENGSHHPGWMRRAAVPGEHVTEKGEGLVNRHRLPEYLRGHSQSWGTKVKNHSLCAHSLGMLLLGREDQGGPGGLAQLHRSQRYTHLGPKKFAPGHFQVRQEKEKWVLKHEKLEETLPGFLFCFWFLFFIVVVFVLPQSQTKQQRRLD